MPEEKPKKNYPIVLLPEERALVVKCLAIAKYPEHNPEPLTLQEQCHVGPLLERLGIGVDVAGATDGAYLVFVDEWGR